MKFLILIFLGFLLGGCSVDSSDEELLFPEDLHKSEHDLAITAEADARRQEDRIAPTDRLLFQIENKILERDNQPFSLTRTKKEISDERKAFYGDLHVHTTYSLDGYAFGTLSTPYDAYRYAKGEAIKNPAGFEMKLKKPMDFYAVTDHAMFLGVLGEASDTNTEFSMNEFSKPFHNLNSPENMDTGLLSQLRRFSVFSDFVPSAVDQIISGQLDRSEVMGVVRNAWKDTINAADLFYEPGKFTTFAAFEYTTFGPNMGNLHRNVIFRGTEKLPREPFSAFHSDNPEDLWDWMDGLREKGVESLAIPHNSNGSNGQMFKLVDWAGNPIDDLYAKQRIRNEPIVEITQIKGTSETHPTLSSRDELAGFEITPYRVGNNSLSKISGSYVREALLNGIKFEQEGITNPFKFGFIGSSDSHIAASQNDEANFTAHHGLISATPELRGSVPLSDATANLRYYAMKAFLDNSPLTKINGEIYANGANPTFGASGLAAVWAEENTRESIYNAFRRKEVFATSGPRIRIRFFASFDFDESMLKAADAIDQAYAKGVTMGGNLLDTRSSAQQTSNTSPGFIVIASADLDSAPLQRLQVVKGWVDDNGTHEEVIDIACANDVKVDPKTNRCPDNGAKVDLSNCSINAETGTNQLSALWHDDEFMDDRSAFYYARAIENPTCRWSTWDAVHAGVEPRPDLHKTIQERAWSSPINYTPH